MPNEVSDVVLDAAQAVMVAWIETHWPRLAAIAWRGYVLAGRGLVVLDGDWAGVVTVGYLTATAAAAVGAPWPAALRAATQAYTPATDILFLVPQGALGTVLRLRATPPLLPPCLVTQRDGRPPWVAAA